MGTYMRTGHRAGSTLLSQSFKSGRSCTQSQNKEPPCRIHDRRAAIRTNTTDIERGSTPLVTAQNPYALGYSPSPAFPLLTMQTSKH